MRNGEMATLKAPQALQDVKVAADRIMPPDDPVPNPSLTLFDWIILAILAFMLAVGMVALFQPLYDITHWKGLMK